MTWDELPTTALAIVRVTFTRRPSQVVLGGQVIVQAGPGLPPPLLPLCWLRREGSGAHAPIAPVLLPLVFHDLPVERLMIDPTQT